MWDVQDAIDVLLARSDKVADHLAFLWLAVIILFILVLLK